MPETHDIGPWFLTTTRFADHQAAPLIAGAVAYENEPPYREGRGSAVRLWPSRLALFFGRWRDSSAGDEDRALLIAMQSHDLEADPEEIAGWHGSGAEKGRQSRTASSGESV